MKKLMFVAAVAAGFGLIAEQSLAAPRDDRHAGTHRRGDRGPARAHAGHRTATPARRHVQPRGVSPVRRPAVVRSPAVVPVRRPVTGYGVARLGFRRPFVPSVGVVVSAYDTCSVRYSLYGARTLSFVDYASAANLVGELQALGAYAELRNGIGRYEVAYSMNGSQVRSFASHAAAHDFELRMEQLGMQAVVLN